jgi:hypothetical protein
MGWVSMLCSVYILSSFFSIQASAREESVNELSLNPSRARTRARRRRAEPNRAWVSGMSRSRPFFLLQVLIPQVTCEN